MATVLDICTDALKELGVLAAGETAPAGEATDAFNALNRLVDQWKAERLQIYTISVTSWPITAFDQSYTVGTGGEVNMAWPSFIERVAVIDSTMTTTTEIPLKALTDEEWLGIKTKSIGSQYPSAFWYDRAFPLGNLWLWPIPSSTTLLGGVYAPTAVAEFASLATTVSLPPGYRRMLVKNLALEIAPSYEKQIDPVLVRQAIEAKEVVKRSNHKLTDLTFPGDALIGGGGHWDIRLGP